MSFSIKYSDCKSKGQNHYFYNNIIYNMSEDATYSWESGTKRNFSSNVYYGFHPGNEPGDQDKNTADPMFTNPGSGGLGIHSVSGYKLQPGSPYINAGLLIPDNGGRDYWGNDITDEKPDIGAFEFSKSTNEVNEKK